MDSSDLAERLIARKSTTHRHRQFTLEDAPDIILEKHPSIYLHGGRLYHEHNEIKAKDNLYLCQLIDEPDAKLSAQQGVWVYNRLVERAAVLSDRYIAISRDMLWDRYTAEILPLEGVITTKDKTTRRING